MNNDHPIVLHIITTMNRGGAEKQLLMLMREQMRIGHQVYIVILKPNPELEKEILDAGIVILGVGFCLKIFRKTRKFSGSEKVVVHAHLPRAELFSRLVLVGRRNCLVVSRHNAEDYGSGKKFGRLNWLSAIVLRRANEVVAISQAVRSFMISNRQVFCSQIDKISIVYYGLESHKLTPSVHESREFRFRLGTISRLVRQKNIDIQLEILKNLNDSYLGRPWTLVVVGEGPEKENLKTLAIRLGVDEEVEFRGKVENVNECYSEFDVFLLTSRYEGFGMVLLEAMCQEIPLVANSTSAIPEVLGESYPGLYDRDSRISLTEKIEQCVDLRHRAFLVSFYAERLDFFDISKSARSICNLYSRVRMN